MKVELIKLQNELKSAQLIVKLLQDERNNQLSDQVNFHNLPNSVEEETNQSELTTQENGRECKKVLSRRVSPNLLKKNPPVFKQQTIPTVVTMNRYEQWPGNQGKSVFVKFKESSRPMKGT
jgi:hypothetical protein